MVVMVMEFMIIFWYVDVIMDRSTSEFLSPTSFMYRIRTSYTRISSGTPTVSPIVVSLLEAAGLFPIEQILGSTQDSLIMALRG